MRATVGGDTTIRTIGTRLLSLETRSYTYPEKRESIPIGYRSSRETNSTRSENGSRIVDTSRYTISSWSRKDCKLGLLKSNTTTKYGH